MFSETRQPAGIGAPVHFFSHLFPGGSVSLIRHAVFNRTPGGALFSRQAPATTAARGAQPIAPGPSSTPGGARPKRPEPPVCKQNFFYFSTLNLPGPCNPQGGAVRGGKPKPKTFFLPQINTDLHG